MTQKLIAITAVAILIVPALIFSLPGSQQWGLPSGVWGLPSGGGWGLPSGSPVGLGLGKDATVTPSPETSPSHQLNAHLIVCVGDSITEGFADPNNWPYHLKTRLGGDWVVVDQGVGGAKTADMAGRLDQALALNPHFVIILGGTNDLANGEVLLATTQENIREMCTRVEAYGAVPVLCTVTPTNFHLAERDVLNAWIAEYASLKGYPIIDFHAAIDDPQHPGYANTALVRSDGVHPTSAGYVAMANAVDLSIFTKSD
ncbi:MAG TPA: GDSL-type esterase/lipase family protein [Candidatus Bathyarchaeia archaeon]|nr:GDSL-type esterase/lipase family protein [Candidatus Bathyarchaeia archaeon]